MIFARRLADIQLHHDEGAASGRAMVHIATALWWFLVGKREQRAQSGAHHNIRWRRGFSRE
jgi:hypothetical protein